MRFVILTSVIIACLNCLGYAADNQDKIIYDMAVEVKNAVLQRDVKSLLKYVAPKGTYFQDAIYSYNEVDALMASSDSWLYKYLFSDTNSVWTYFNKAQDLKIIISIRNRNAVFVSYRSSNYNPNDWIECCFIKIKGTWYFDGIFYCK